MIVEDIATSSYCRADAVEERNMLFLMESSDASKVKEFLRLRMCEEFKKLQKWMEDNAQWKIFETKAQERNDQLQ